MSLNSNSVRTEGVWFTEPNKVEVREKEISSPGPDQVMVSTLYSAISAGSELLLYRGELPDDISLDNSIESLKKGVAYPLQYGYACVGEVTYIGSQVDRSWEGRKVFCFHPHESYFLAETKDLLLIPDNVAPSDAIFLPNMETAVNLIQDGRPAIGERAVVLGQGVVGLLLAELLSEFPLSSLVVIEKNLERHRWSKLIGIGNVCGPDEVLETDLISLGGADLLYEVSGNTEALNLAIKLSGYCSRVVIGSWYGNRAMKVDLGGEAHRNRLQLITSQVSTIEPGLTGRWNKKRRIDLAWEMIDKVKPSKFITHAVPVREAPSLYRQLSEGTEGLLQVVFEYRDKKVAYV